MQKAEGDEYEGVGFRFSDLEAFYADCVYKKKDKEIVNVDINKNPKLADAMDTLYQDLDEEQLDYLGKLKIPVWELIIRNSGGHPSITNISGLNFLKHNKKMLNIAYNTEKYVEVLKVIARDFINVLKEKIDIVNKGGSVEYDTKGVELTGHDTNESFEYQLVNKGGQTKTVTKDEFLKAGAAKGMKTDRKSLMTIDQTNKRIIAKFESFQTIENNQEEVNIGDKFRFINPKNKSQEIKFEITSLDKENDIANVRIYYPEINDTVFSISKLNTCERI